MRNRTLLLMSVLLMALLILAACGKQDASSERQDTTPTVSAVVGDATAGKEVYLGTCVACHGPDAKGVKALGKSLHASDSEFVRGKSDSELVKFIEQGRTPDDPLNTTGVGMPARGGNPAITEQQLYDVVAWIRTLK